MLPQELICVNSCLCLNRTIDMTFFMSALTSTLAGRAGLPLSIAGPSSMLRKITIDVHELRSLAGLESIFRKKRST